MEGTKFMTNSKRASQLYNRAGGTICIHFAIILVVSMIFTICVAIVTALSGKAGKELTDTLVSGPVTLYSTAIGYITANILGTVIVLAFCGRLKNSLRGMFNKPDIKTGTMLLCIPAAMFIQSVSILLQTLFSGITGSSGMENMQMPELIEGNTLNNTVYVAYIAILGPICEELLFRGGIMRCMNFAGRWFAIFSSALLFALFHGNIMQGIIAFLLGIFFGYLDMKTGSIIPSVILHITNNSIATLMELYEFTTKKEIPDAAVYIYLAASIVLGAVCMFLVIRKIKPSEYHSNEFFAPEIIPEPEEKKNCGIKAALKAPLMWLACIIYIIMIIVNI